MQIKIEGYICRNSVQLQKERPQGQGYQGLKKITMDGFLPQYSLYGVASVCMPQADLKEKTQ